MLCYIELTADDGVLCLWSILPAYLTHQVTCKVETIKVQWLQPFVMLGESPFKLIYLPALLN